MPISADLNEQGAPMPRPELSRCERCFGRGYQGRWRTTARGKAWKLETCRGCGGRGERVYARKVLIAAAPELLAAAAVAALECIQKHVPATVFAPRERLRAAIAKATGETT